MDSKRYHSRPSGWLYVGWFMCVCYCVWMPIREEWNIHNLRAQAVYELTPGLSLEELASRIESLDMASRLPGDSPEQFYIVSVESFALMRAMERRIAFDGRGLEINKLELRWARVSSRQTPLFNEYVAKFTQPEMRKAAKQFENTPPYAAPPELSISIPRGEANRAWFNAYPWIAFLFSFFFCIRLRREGMRVRLEVANIFCACWSWPIAIFVYPTCVDLETQTRRAKLWAAYAFSALVSLLPFGSMAKAQGVGKNGRPVYSLTETVRDRYLNITGVDLYPNTISVTELKVSWRDWEVGVRGFKGLGKKNFSRHSLGNEINLFAGWKRRWVDWLETQLGLEYHMNDSPVPGGGIEMARDDQIMLDARVSFLNLVPWVVPYLSYRYFGAVGKSSPHSGSFGWLGFQRQQPFWLFGREAPLSLDLQLAFSDGALGKKGKDGGFIYGRFNLLWLFKLTENLSLGPQIFWLVADGSQHGGPRDYVEGRYAFGYGFRVQQQW